MRTSFDCTATLSEQELLDHFTDLVVRDRRITADLLVAIAEIDERKLWAKHACSSMFTFCMERFHMSEQVAAKRIWAARTARRFPVVLEMVERGELHLGAIHLLAKHLTEENHVRVLARAKHKSSRDVERLVSELAPRADVPSRVRALPRSREAGAATAMFSNAGPADCNRAADIRDQPVPAGREAALRASAGTAAPRPATKPIVPLSPRRYKIEITVDEATHDKLRSLQDLLGRSETGRDPAAIIVRAIDVLLVRTLARKAGATDRPKPTKATTETNAASTVTCEPAISARPTGTASGVKRPEPPTPAASRRPRTGATPAASAAASSRAQRTRTIPAAVRREVWRRDCGRCCYADAFGRRCRETSNVEFHHRDPFAMGGPHSSGNIELRCAAHNQYQADLDFGRSFMNGRRARNVREATFPGECSDRGRFFEDSRRGETARKFPG